MINETKEKKAKILLRNVVYSSLYNERPKRAGDKCVFERVLHNGGAFTVVLWQSHCVGVYNKQ